eukprot:1141460-Pelagomonas_calceolata.AAC.6
MACREQTVVSRVVSWLKMTSRTADALLLRVQGAHGLCAEEHTQIGMHAHMQAACALLKH